MLGRRSLVGVALAYAGLTAAVVLASSLYTCIGKVATPAALERPVTDALRVFLGPVAPGATVGGWTVHELGPLRNGNLRVELRHGGERAALTLVRRDGKPGAVAETAHLALYPAVHDLATHVPTAATRQAAAALADALPDGEPPDVLLPLH